MLNASDLFKTGLGGHLRQTAVWTSAKALLIIKVVSESRYRFSSGKLTGLCALPLSAYAQLGKSE